MSGFKFNFGGSEEDEDERSTSDADFVDSGPASSEVEWVPANNFPDQLKTDTIERSFGEHTIHTVASDAVEDYLMKKGCKDSDVVNAISASSDLVAGQYEGGLKVWECSRDLCHYFVNHETPVKGCRVLDLGCGSGLLGLLAFKLGAASVHFQDFNAEVLETYTMRNLELNSLQHSACKFFAGDWASFASLAESRNIRYDLILTAETIYSEKSYAKLLKVFSSLLAESGTIFLAAKNDYIGVGGGVATFTQRVKAGKKFEVETVHVIKAALPRKILRITRIKS